MIPDGYWADYFAERKSDKFWPRLWCLIRYRHKPSEWIKARAYRPPQRFVIGCHRCKRCGKENWV